MSLLKASKTILSGLLAVFVLMSSISHSINFHICGGKIQSMAIFGQAKTCEEHASICHHDENKAALEQKECCENATILLDSDKNVSKVTQKVAVEDFQFVFLPVRDLILQANPQISFAPATFLNYKPPLIERDITVLVQTFLI